MKNIRQITGMTGKNEKKNSLEVRRGLRKWRDRKVAAIKTSKLDVNRKVRKQLARFKKQTRFEKSGQELRSGNEENEAGRK